MFDVRPLQTRGHPGERPRVWSELGVCQGPDWGDRPELEGDHARPGPGGDLHQEPHPRSVSIIILPGGAALGLRFI